MGNPERGFIMNKDRLVGLGNLLQREGIEAALIGASPDLQYLTGLSPARDSRFKGLFVMPGGKYFYVTSSLYLEESQRLLGADAPIYIWYDADGFLDGLKRGASDFNLKKGRLAVNDGVSAVHLLDILSVLDFDAVKGDHLVSELRIVKSKDEMENMRMASRIIDSVVEGLVDFIRPGLKEKDISQKIEELCYEKGATGLSFGPIVASGPNSSMPHYNGNQRVIQERDIVLVDLGCKYKDYCSDTTRTFFLGEPDDKIKRVYETVLQANLAAEAFAKEGVVAEEVDKKARDVIEKAGLGQYFITRTGHGIGINVHEQPNIVAGNKQILKNGMAFSIEPGVYIPGEFGIRIEDIVLINEGKAEVLNKFPKKMMIIG